MSIKVAEGVVEVTADASDVGKEVARDIDRAQPDVEKSGDSLGNRMASGLGKGLLVVGEVVGKAMLAATGAVAVGIGVIAVKGVQFNAAMQNYQAAFTPLLGGADQAQAKLAELSAFAAATPFEMTGLAKASQTMLAFGEDSQKLLPDLKMLGDISQGNQEKLDGLALVFGQVQSQGKLMGQDVYQMINQGFNPLVEISKMTGESMSDLKGRMEDGAISFDEVRAAMQHATSEGGQFYDAMALGSRTLTGAWSSTQDGANILSGALTASLTPALTGILNDGINPLLGGLVDLVNGTEGAQATIDTASANLITGISNLGPAVQSIFSNLGVLLAAVGPSLSEALGYIVTGLVSVLPSVITFAGQLILTLITAIAGAAPMLVETAVPLLLGFVGSLVGMLPMLIQTGFDILLALVNGVTASLPTLIPQVVTAIVGSLLTLFAPGNLTALLDAGLALLMGLVNGILTALPTLIAALPSIIVGIVSFLQTALPTLMEAGVALLSALVTNMPVIVQAVVNAIPQIITGLMLALTASIPQLITAGVKLLVSLITDLPTIIQTIVTAGPKIVVAIINEFRKPETLKKFADSGQELIKGLWEGISDMASWIKGKIEGFGAGILNNLKSFFGIKSPSRVLRDEVGKMLGMGLAEGITGTTGLVSAAAMGLGAAARDGVGTMGIATMGVQIGGGVTGDGVDPFDFGRPPGFPPSGASGGSSMAASGGGNTYQLNQRIESVDPELGARQAARAFEEFTGVRG